MEIASIKGRCEGNNIKQGYFCVIFLIFSTFPVITKANTFNIATDFIYYDVRQETELQVSNFTSTYLALFFIGPDLFNYYLDQIYPAYLLFNHSEIDFVFIYFHEMNEKVNIHDLYNETQICNKGFLNDTTLYEQILGHSAGILPLFYLLHVQDKTILYEQKTQVLTCLFSILQNYDIAIPDYTFLYPNYTYQKTANMNYMVPFLIILLNVIGLIGLFCLRKAFQ